VSTFNGWNIVTMPSTPAPRDVAFAMVQSAAISISPFTGQQQTQDWNAMSLRMTFNLPPMNATDGAAWVVFLVAMKGIVNVCQLTAACFASNALVPATGTYTGYWRLSKNNPEISISPGLVYGTSLEFIEAK
jgi:hypothetical protein